MIVELAQQRVIKCGNGREETALRELKRLREEKGWSQTKLASESGIDRATINQVEGGKRSPTIATLEVLADVMDVEVADFFPKAQPPLPLHEEHRGLTEDFLELVNFQLERFLRGEDPKLVVGGLTLAVERLVEWIKPPFEGEAKRLAGLSVRVLFEADPNSVYWPLERKRLQEGLESLAESPEESRKT
jgi:transcriptional regulator with XRE-family HTH domain